MKVALAHDYLTQRGGAERVALELTRVFPEAELFTSLYEPDDTFPEFADVRVRTSPLNRVAALRRNFRMGLPLFGWSFDHAEAAPDAEVMVISTTGFAHGIRTPAAKVVYCHSPARFLYLTDEYLGRPWWRSPLGWGLRGLRPRLIAWDQRAARSASLYLCNSTVVRDRIRQVYGIEATVVPPPAGLDPHGRREPVAALQGWPDHHLLVSRLMPYKNVDRVIEAFRSLPAERLLIVGRGPLRDQLASSLPDNVRLAEGLSDAQLRTAYAEAKSVVAASHEDFGLTPVEGFGFGVPTIALRAGGYLDTVIEGVSGWFFDHPTPPEIAAAVRWLADHPIDEDAIREHARQFSAEAFAAAVKSAVSQVTQGGRSQ